MAAAVKTVVLIDTGKSQLISIPNYSPDIYTQVKDVFTYEEPPIMIMGRECRQRRDVSFYSDESKGYAYSGQFMPALPLAKAPILQDLLPKINASLGTKFNAILVNRYRNGEKYLSAHSDDERALDTRNNMVVGIAYGGVRNFRIRDKKTKAIVLDHDHQPCELLIMQGDFQKEFTHEIPVQKKVTTERISLTFRHHTE